MNDELARAVDGIDAFAARPGFAFSDEELVAATVDLAGLVSRATGVLATLVHEARGRDLPRSQAATSTVAWLRDVLRIAARDARQLVTLGEVLDARPVLADAVASGTVNAGQAAAAGRVLSAIPADDPALVDKVEAQLVECAAQFEPTLLQRLGERIIAHIDPDLADRRLRERLEREERHAWERRGFTLSADGLGGMRLSGVLDAECAAIVTAAIDPLAKPLRGEDGPDLRLPAARRADALVEVCRMTLASGGLPENGGTPPQITVTVDWEALRRDVAVGQLDTGAMLSPDAVRRLACDAQILPAVLGGAGVPINLGRTRRLFTGAARQAVLLRDHGCAFPGCDRPERWTTIHHIQHWVHGGSTARDNGVALCNYHHRIVHHGGWAVRLAPDKHPEFVPPPHVDPAQRPRRNPYHPRR
ncbi:MAG TPA: DUF222 domain-containing protein [Micromonosporaceae bacterium]|nr:DUF222 domain-containing protein [Micromonosporaceae bacterium]